MADFWMEPRRRVAVIGGGISGMGAARALAPRCEVTLFEAGPRLGGHACTVMGGRNRDLPVDIGFIVYNEANYPHLTRLFRELDVPVAEAAMTFGVSIDGGRLEYALKDLGALFAQRRNALRPQFWRLMRDILRFNTRAHFYARDDGLTLREMLEDLQLSDWFRDYYILPFSGAIWSTPVAGVLDFPAAALVRFFQNHNLLGIKGQHQWYTVQGGSREYVTRLEAALAAAGVTLRTGQPVETVLREPGGVRVKPAGGDWQSFDEVVFACHSDDAIAMLGDPSEDERQSVGAIAYQPNEIVLHGDARMMPKRRSAWASWVYTEERDRRSDRIDLTYWMNSLQPIPGNEQCFVTLNTTRAIDPGLVWHRATFRHPVYVTGTLTAQKRVEALNGTQNTWFCGAWLRNGFHEDGLATGIETAERLLARLPVGVAA
mgnify:CR=1 FL=1